jgi:hypothetical protein
MRLHVSAFALVLVCLLPSTEVWGAETVHSLLQKIEEGRAWSRDVSFEGQSKCLASGSWIAPGAASQEIVEFTYDREESRVRIDSTMELLRADGEALPQSGMRQVVVMTPDPYVIEYDVSADGKSYRNVRFSDHKEQHHLRTRILARPHFQMQMEGVYRNGEDTHDILELIRNAPSSLLKEETDAELRAHYVVTASTSVGNVVMRVTKGENAIASIQISEEFGGDKHPFGETDPRREFDVPWKAWSYAMKVSKFEQHGKYMIPVAGTVESTITTTDGRWSTGRYEYRRSHIKLRPDRPEGAFRSGLPDGIPMYPLDKAGQEPAYRGVRYESHDGGIRECKDEEAAQPIQDTVRQQ